LKIYEEIVQMMDAGDIDHDEGVMGRSHGSD